MCIKDNRPFGVVDDEGLREFAWELNPLFKFPSRWTVARDCLSIYKKEAKRLKDLLKGQTVSLTIDTWSSVDDDWILRKKILNFCPIANHRVDTIGKLVYFCIQKWGIEKVFTVMVDNASSNDSVIRYLKTMLRGPNDVLDCKYSHLRCCAHIINLVVRDGLEAQCGLISRIRNAVRYSSFKECVDRVQIKRNRKPCLDVDTRWNSTFFMLETAVKYEDAFDRLFDIDSNYISYLQDEAEDDSEGSTRKQKRSGATNGAPTSQDWEKDMNFVEYLRIFSEVTTKFSGSKYVTSNLFFSELVTMQATITRMCHSIDGEKQKMAKSMKLKYDKYWDNIENMNLLLYVVVALDPHNKHLLCRNDIWHRENKTDYQRSVSLVILDKVKKTLEDFFEHYQKKAEMRKEKRSVGSTSSNGMPSALGDTRINLEHGFDIYDDEEEDCKSELEVYLADGKEKRDERFDILGWWKENSTKFPILSQLARHVLAMPISTVASESAFSTGGRVIDKYRSSLNPKTAEALICTQDWIRSSLVDIELLDMSIASIEELNENLKNIELDELPNVKDTSNVED
ncbi:LOW QUALITY PROTEIN: hypothetical protein OSB04_019095 [Centaurea solstitialis]|uniref:Transposase n=1 Tax=Centaurea solstitialis TaxID=347529 RepID=A0AA38T842_9ASTR|nr:LOW QUALITY PROTEIN: hypothetical protein OSB04_019095 [Centaurea solstitialis]